MSTNTRGAPTVFILALLTTVVFLFQGCQQKRVSPFATPRSQVHKLFEPGRGSGSGVVIAPGVVLTAGHVASHPGLNVLVAPPQGDKGKTKAVDQDHDLGLIEYPADIVTCPCAKLADHEAELDERVIVVGFPYGIGATAGRSVVTEGRSQGVMLLPDGDVKLIVTAPVAPGNSGGGVYVFRDGEWQLVGILVASTPQGAVSIVVPLSDIKAFLAANAK